MSDKMIVMSYDGERYGIYALKTNDMHFNLVETTIQVFSDSNYKTPDEAYLEALKYFRTLQRKEFM